MMSARYSPLSFGLPAATDSPVCLGELQVAPPRPRGQSSAEDLPARTRGRRLACHFS